MSRAATPADVIARRARWCVEGGDCRATIAALPDECVDAIVTDPPYGIGHDSNYAGSEWAYQIEGDDRPHTDWILDAARVLRPNCALYLFTRWDVEHEWIAAVRAAGLHVKQSIVWDRGTHGMGDLRGSYGYAHERVIFATKGRHVLRGPRLPDVWRVPAIFSREWKWHPHEKPVDLLRIPVEASTDADGVVFDPFCGSGSTLAACLVAGRRGIACELDDRWRSWAAARLGGAARRDPNGDSAARQLGLFDAGGAR